MDALCPNPIIYQTTVTDCTPNLSIINHKIDCKVCLDKTLPAYPSCPSSLVRLECPENQNKRAQWDGKQSRLRKRGVWGRQEKRREKKDIKTFYDNHVKRNKTDIVIKNYFKAATTRNSWLQPNQHQHSYGRLRPTYTYMLYVYVK